MNTTELLAPAGSFASLKAALAAGADAVYTGGQLFGARAYAENLSGEELTEAIDLVHLAGKKLYLTVNTLLKEKELQESLYDYLLPVYRAGLDGVLVQDFGVLRFVRREFPDLPVHASTQMAVTGPAGAEFLESLGVSRLVAARELSLKELAYIRGRTSMELEAFVHGALCYSYSGQCLMSSMIVGRSGNRGRCAQPCRLPYEVWEKEKRLNGKNTAYPLNTKDMCTVELLPDILRAGVMSLKIEGRMKKPEYTAGVVEIYRKYLDEYLGRREYYDRYPDRYQVAEKDKKRLFQLFNRDGFNQSYFLARNGREMMALKNVKLTEKRQTEKPEPEKNAEVSEEKIPAEGILELIPGHAARFAVTAGGYSAVAEGAEVQPAKNRPLTEERARIQMEKTGNSSFFFKKLEIRMGGDVFVPVQVLNELRREGLAAAREKMLSGWRRTPPGNRGQISLPQPVQRQEAGKSGELRVLTERPEQLDSLARLSGISGYYLPITLFRPGQWREEFRKTAEKLTSAGKKVYLALPYILRKDGKSEFAEKLEGLEEEGISGILVRNLESFGILRKMNLQRLAILDAGMYTFNSQSLQFWRENGIQGDTAPWELNRRELRERDNRFSELILYGRTPMMLSSQCLKKNLDRCTGRGDLLTLRDRKGMRFPVQCVCSCCCNIIYNSLPTSLESEWEEIRSLGFRSYRLNFTVESGREAAETAERFLAVLGGEKPAEPLGNGREYTKGHFRRGVE